MQSDMTYTITIQGDLSVARDDLHDNVVVELVFEDGTRYIATFFTLASIIALMQRDQETGEREGGLYFWAIKPVIVRELTRDLIHRTVNVMIEEDWALDCGFHRVPDASAEPDVPVVHTDPDYHLRIYHMVDFPPEIRDANVDVEIRFPDERRYAASFFTLENIAYLMDRHARTGESDSGRHFYTVDLIIVREITKENIHATIDALLQRRELEKALLYLDDDDDDDDELE